MLAIVNFRKNWRVLSIAALAVALVGFALYATRTHEPSIEGQSLGSLLTQIVTARNETEGGLAVGRVQQIGTNAIPFLLQLIRARDSKSKEWAINLLRKQHVFNFQIENATGKHLRAAFGFEALGTNANSAIPELKDMLDGPETVQLAGMSLIGIGPAGVDAVVSGMVSTNAIIRRECAGLLGSLGIARFSTNGSLARMEALQARGYVAVPPLVAALNDSDELVRARAATALGLLGQQPSVVLPALIKNLHETNGWRVPASAAKALGRLGPGAIVAIPELRKVSDHPDMRVREAVEGAIRALEAQSTPRPD